MTLEFAEQLREKISLALVYFPIAVIGGYTQTWLAQKFGDDTAQLTGYKTISPAKHFDPLGFILLVFTKYGWFKQIPINPENINPPHRFAKLLTILWFPSIIYFLIGCITLFILIIMEGVKFNQASVAITSGSSIFYTLNYVLLIFLFSNITFSIINFVIGLIRLIVMKVTQTPDYYLQKFNIGFVILMFILLWIAAYYTEQLVFKLIIMVEWLFRKLLIH